MINNRVSAADAFKHNRARKNAIYGGAVILGAITLISSVSSFMIYRAGFADLPYLVQQGLALAAVVIVEGGFVLLLYGFTRAYSSAIERAVSLFGLMFIVVTMTLNIVTHFMMAKNIPLQPFQQSWIAWGAITVFIGILLIILVITLGDPVIRLIRLELRYLGKQEETILEAKNASLDSDKIHQAMQGRAEFEAKQLAQRILGDAIQRNLPKAGFQPSAHDRPKLYAQTIDEDRERKNG